MEEVDELFEARLAAWNFKNYETHGTGRLLAEIENQGVIEDKAEVSEKI